MQQLYELSNPRVALSFTLPEGLTATDVEAVLRKAVERNEALRTIFEVDGSGELMQVVTSPERPLDVEVIEVDGAEAAEELVRELTPRLVRKPFDVTAEWPVRAAVVVAASRPQRLVVIVDHVAADALGTVVLKAELAELIQAVAESRAPAERAPGRQPVDHAAREQRLAGSGAEANALRYFDEQLRRIPHRMFTTKVSDGGGPAFRLATMRSPTAPGCLRRVSDRYGVTEPVVLLAAYAALVSLKTGCELCAIFDIVGNRLDPKDRAAVSCLLQPVVISVDLAGDPRFSEVVRRAGAACREGYRHSRYPTDKVMELQAVRAFERGAAFDGRVTLNYIDLRTQPKGAGGQALLPADLAADPPADTEVSWQEVGYREAPADLALGAVPQDDQLVLRLMGRASVITAGELERLLRGIEQVLSEAAAGGDPSLSEVAERSEVRPPERDERWALVGSQWVNVRDVEELLRSGPGVSAASVFHVEHEDGRDGGQASLVAYVAPSAGEVTPLALRRFVLASLPRWPSVVAPDWYVICRQAPLRGTGPEPGPGTGPGPTLPEWRRQEVVLEGSGRSIPEVAPRTDEEKALCRAIAQANRLPSVSVEASYVLAGGRIRRIPAVRLALRRDGYDGLALRDLIGATSIGQAAARLTRTGSSG